MDISSLHRSISEFSTDELKIHIRNIRNLRRQFIKVKVKTPKKSQKKQKKLILKPDISKLSPSEKQSLLQKLLKIKEDQNGKR